MAALRKRLSLPRVMCLAVAAVGLASGVSARLLADGAAADADDGGTRSHARALLAPCGPRFGDDCPAPLTSAPEPPAPPAPPAPPVPPPTAPDPPIPQPSDVSMRNPIIQTLIRKFTPMYVFHSKVRHRAWQLKSLCVCHANVVCSAAVKATTVHTHRANGLARASHASGPSRMCRHARCIAPSSANNHTLSAVATWRCLVQAA